MTNDPNKLEGAKNATLGPLYDEPLVAPKQAQASKQASGSNQADFDGLAPEDFQDEPSDEERKSKLSLQKSESNLEEELRVENSEDGFNSQDKHHVGPVMGIFFKVWSLVKVTKARNGHKLRNAGSQNNENAHQFQYISGEQLQQQTQQKRQTLNSSQSSGQQFLQDRHFRRAGSQPVQSSSVDSGQSKFVLINRGEPSASNTSTAATTATSSSNSASLLANNSIQSNSSQANGVGKRSSSVRRNVSAYSLQRSLVEPINLLAATNGQAPPILGHNSSLNLNLNSNLSSKSGWANKIKRSAETVNQSDPVSSYVSSKYREFKLKNPKLTKRRSAKGKTADNLARANSGYYLNGAGGNNADLIDLANDNAREDNNYETEDYEAGDDDECADNDSNDIYSTPNDSIQSVPGSAPLIGLAQQKQRLSGPNSNRTPLSQPNAPEPVPYYPIIKSFSTNNFNQLVAKQQLVNRDGHRRFQPIEEAQLISGKRAGHNARENLAKHISIDRENSSDIYSDASPEGGQVDAIGNVNGKGQNNSRFFISSSSSEDSNSPANVASTGAVIALEGQQKSQVEANQLDGAHRRIQIPLKQGVHYHHPPNVLKPDSLLLQQHYAPILLPTTGGSYIAAMSPVDCFSANNVLVSELKSKRMSLTSGQQYKKSPSLFEISQQQQQLQQQPPAHPRTRSGSKFPLAGDMLFSFKPRDSQPNSNQSLVNQQIQAPTTTISNSKVSLPNSISLYDYKFLNDTDSPETNENLFQMEPNMFDLDQYRLTQMLLEFGSNKQARDSNGNTALMQAVISDNLSAIRCLILEHQVDLNEVNNFQLSALDLACAKPANQVRLDILQLLIDNKANIDRVRASDNSRLLDRLIRTHCASSDNNYNFTRLTNNSIDGPSRDKSAYIDCLLTNGAKLGSSTWLAANRKFEIQLKLLKKLNQDGYFLYKQSSIEEAVYRFEYALKRLAECELQFSERQTGPPPNYNSSSNNNNNNNIIQFRQQRNSILLINSPRNQLLFSSLSSFNVSLIWLELKKIKYQIYLGLSRCERKRRFNKRALEFANLAILVDCTLYEAFYSKAHILKDLKEFDESLMVIEQANKLIEKLIESIELESKDLHYQQQESSVLFKNNHDNQLASSMAPDFKEHLNLIETSKLELSSNLNYLFEAKKFVSKLRQEILDEMNINRLDKTKEDSQIDQLIHLNS